MKTEKSVSKFLLSLKLFLFIVLLTASCNVFAGYYFVYTSIPDESCSDAFYEPPVIHHHYHHYVIHKHKTIHHVIHHRRSSYPISVYYPIPPCAEERSCNSCACHTCHHSGYQTHDYVVYQSDPEDAFSSGETYEQTDEPNNEPSTDTCTADDTD